MKEWWRNGDRWKAIKPVPLQLLFSQEWSQIQRMFQRSVPPTQAGVSWQNATSTSALLADVLWPVSVETGVSYPTGCHLCVKKCVHIFPPLELWFWSIYQEEPPSSVIPCVLCFVCVECRHFSDTAHLPSQTVMWPFVQVSFSSYMC